jgi:hypothetical protein
LQLAQAADQGLAEMTGASRHQDLHARVAPPLTRSLKRILI